MDKGYIFDIKKFAIHDGPGIRTAVYLKGCPLRCWWCHNPESHKVLPEKYEGYNPVRGYSKSISACEEEIGKLVTVDEITNEVEKDRVFYDNSGGGVTFSGGEPLMQTNFLKSLLIASKENSISTAVDTSGYSSIENIMEILPFTDLFLYDIKLLDEELHRKYTGVSNKLILENLKMLIKLNKNIIIRIPIVPEITDTRENIDAILNFFKLNPGIVEINLLPYHKAGEGKYKRFAVENKLPGLTSPGSEHLNRIKQHFESVPLKVKIGG